MADVKHNKRCEHQRCTKRPNFNHVGEVVGRFCAEHKLAGMVDLNNKKRCEHRGCTKQPAFNHEGEVGHRFCAEHKLKGKVNVKSKGAQCVDSEMIEMNQVIQQKIAVCQHHDCKQISVFNYLSYGARQVSKYCEDHKMEGMVDVRDIVVVKEEI